MFLFISVSVNWFLNSAMRINAIIISMTGKEMIRLNETKKKLKSLKPADKKKSAGADF